MKTLLLGILLLFFSLFPFLGESQSLPIGIVKETGVSVTAVTPLNDSVFYCMDGVHGQFELPGIRSYLINAQGTILDTMTLRWMQDSFYLQTFPSIGRNGLLLSSGNVVVAPSVLDTISDYQRPIFIKMQTTPNLDSLKSKHLLFDTSITNLTHSTCYGLHSLSDSTFLAFGIAQISGSFNGHLEFGRWVAILDTNLNVLQQQMHTRWDHPDTALRFDWYNVIQAPDGGFVFGTQGRLIPDGGQIEYAGVTKLDSNLNVEWDYYAPSLFTDWKLTVSPSVLFTLPDDPLHFYSVHSYGDTCDIHRNWTGRCPGNTSLNNRRFIKYNWQGQIINEKIDVLRKPNYGIQDAVVFGDAVYIVSNSNEYFHPIIGAVEKFNTTFDSIWYVEPDAGLPPRDSMQNINRWYVFRNLTLLGKKLVAGGFMITFDTAPNPFQFMYLTIIDTNGTYQDGTPIGYWLSAEAVTKEWTFKVYPQPATTQLTLEIATEAQATTLELYDLTGRKLLSQRLDPFTDRHEVSLQGISTGSYLLHVLGDNGLIGVKKVVVH